MSIAIELSITKSECSFQRAAHFGWFFIFVFILGVNVWSEIGRELVKMQSRKAHIFLNRKCANNHESYSYLRLFLFVELFHTDRSFRKKLMFCIC